MLSRYDRITTSNYEGYGTFRPFWERPKLYITYQIVDVQLECGQVSEACLIQMDK